MDNLYLLKKFPSFLSLSDAFSTERCWILSNAFLGGGGGHLLR